MKKGKKIFIYAIITAFILVAGFWYFGRTKAQDYEIIEPEIKDLIQEVDVTGRVKSSQSVDLAFEASGKVAGVYVDVGDKVAYGQTLISLRNDDLSAQLREAEANVKIQQAKLNELKRGARPEDIQIKQAELQKSEQDLDNYYSDALVKINDAYTKSDDSVRIKTSGIFTGSYSSSYKLTFDPCDTQIKIDAEWLRFVSESGLNEWQKKLAAINSVQNAKILDSDISDAENYVSSFKNFLSKASSALTTSCSLENSLLNSYRTNITSARNNVDTALDNISSVEQSISAQKIYVEKIKNEFSLLKIGTAEEQIEAQEAQVEQASATVDKIKAQISKTILKSPINGIISSREVKVGEIVSVNVSVVSVISESDFEIEANIPEADLEKLNVGDKASITLDAYGSEVVFNAVVSKIDPSGVLIEGVATYKTTLQFIGKDERIKTGMTANIIIEADRKNGVLALQQRAIKKKNGDQYVFIEIGKNKTEERAVETGMRGSDGSVEIILGVKIGDKVAVF